MRPGRTFWGVIRHEERSRERVDGVSTLVNALGRALLRDATGWPVSLRLNLSNVALRRCDRSWPTTSNPTESVRAIRQGRTARQHVSNEAGEQKIDDRCCHCPDHGDCKMYDGQDVRIVYETRGLTII